MTISSPAYGILIRCALEDDPRQGQTDWINLLEVEDEDDIQSIIDCLTGKACDPYPDTWIDEGTFEVAEVRGLGPRLAAFACDEQGPLLDTLTDLATALQMLQPHEVAPFLAWAETEGSYWLPGYASDIGGQTPEDAVEMYRIGAP